jgi:hypothetical protein
MATESGSDKIVCPKCGFQQYKRSAICKKCGLIFDKWREMQAKKQKAERAEMSSAPEMEEVSESRVSPLLVILAIAAIAIAGYTLFIRQPTPVAPAPNPPAQAAAPNAHPPTGAPVTGVVRNTDSTAPPSAPPTAPPPRPEVVRTVDPEAARYDTYRGELGQALQLLAGFEKKLREGLDFKTMRGEFLEVRTAVARAFKNPPNESWVSYQAVEKALNAYSDSLKFWEYRVYSADYRNKLWCAGDTCPFQTEQDFKEAVGGYVNLCWDKASVFRGIAERYAQLGDGMRLENDASVRQELAESYAAVDDIWKKLGRSVGP